MKRLARLCVMLLGFMYVGACPAVSQEKAAGSQPAVKGPTNEYLAAYLADIDSTAHVTELDKTKALALAEAGTAPAQMNMFFLLYYGVLAKSDDSFTADAHAMDVCLASNWLSAAARQNYPPAFLWLSHIYFLGNGVEVNHERGYAWHLHWLKSRGVDVSLPIAAAEHFKVPDDRRASLQSVAKSSDATPELPQVLASCMGCEAAGNHSCNSKAPHEDFRN